MQIVDGHCHVGKGFEKSLEPEKLLSLMDENGVNKAVICPIEQYIAVFCAEGNEYIRSLLQKYPDRFIGFATANPWYLETAYHMIKECFEDGMSGLKLNPKLQGFRINSDLVKPLIELAGLYHRPIYFHTGTPVSSEPFQLRELALLYPEVSFIMGHSGNTDFWTDIERCAGDIKNIYLETSHNLSIMSLVNIAGTDRVIFGSNMPRSHVAHELKKVLELDVSYEALSDICAGNILRITGAMK